MAFNILWFIMPDSQSKTMIIQANSIFHVSHYPLPTKNVPSYISPHFHQLANQISDHYKILSEFQENIEYFSPLILSCTLYLLP